ncbi:MAG: phosphopantothenoylcysteine decarboxylase [Phycisphaerales bacterium]|nr:phosphopantothenoylcysteine decarboxylase [Phycisphaerales bacterium]
MPPSAGQSSPESPDEHASRGSHPRILVTAGPTQEPIDSVRFIGNRSSGRMGLAISEAARGLGCPTTLLLGPVPQPPPESEDLHRFQTGAELQGLIQAHWPSHDILIMAAAVGDFMPTTPVDGKGPKRAGPMTLELLPTPDLLSEAATNSQPHQTLIGFALEEATDLTTRGQLKLQEKGLHALVANPLKTMDADTIEAILLVRDQPTRQPGGSMTKPDFASWLMQQALEIHDSREAGSP